MKVYNNLDIKKKHKSSVIAIGNFDGIHSGHQKVIKEAKRKAKKNNLRAGIITFEPIPVIYFNPKIKNHRINSFEQKINQLKKFNLDFVITIKFNKGFSKLTPEQFIKKIIFKKTNAKFVYVSKNFRFGNRRKGNIGTLKKYEKDFGYKTIITSPLKKVKRTISSTLIRNKISQGKIYEANKLLKRFWCIKGKIIRGAKRGRKIGFPTCNIEMGNYVIPKLGVYSVYVNIGKFNRSGIANLGYRPTFNGQNLLLEVNIFGIKKNLYDKEINVYFKKFIRSEKKFKNVEQLKRQIKLDIINAKK